MAKTPTAAKSAKPAPAKPAAVQDQAAEPAGQTEPAASDKPAEQAPAPVADEKPAEDPRAHLGELVHEQHVSDEDAARIMAGLAPASADQAADDQAAAAHEGATGLEIAAEYAVPEFAAALTRLTDDERATLARLFIKMGAPAEDPALLGVPLAAEEVPTAGDDLPDLTELAGHQLEVRSVRKEGRRRIGHAFTQDVTTLAVDDLSAEDLRQLFSDSELTVTVV
jgi:hypothetical protein